MRFALKTSVRGRLTFTIMIVIALSWVLTTITQQYYAYKDMTTFRHEMAVRETEMRRFGPGPDGLGDRFPGGRGAPSLSGQAGQGPGPGPVPRNGGAPDAPPDRSPMELPPWFFHNIPAAGFIALALSLLAGRWLSLRFTKPLTDLAEGARAFHGREFTHRIPASGDDEFAKVAATMNEMAEEVGAQITALEDDARRRRQILADVAHELRSPVATLEVMAAALKDGMADSPERRSEALSYMIDSAARMRRLVNDLLEVARLDMRELPLICAPLDLRDVATDAIDRHIQPAAQAKVRVLPFGDSPPVVINGDSLRLSQVVDNLVENSISYAGEGAEIAVAVADNPARLIVSDTGHGIPAKDMPFVFDPFFRGDTARTPGDNHSGLGLRIARGLMEAHGGTLTIESEEGRGTCATLEFPVNNKGLGDNEERDSTKPT